MISRLPLWVPLFAGACSPPPIDAFTQVDVTVVDSSSAVHEAFDRVYDEAQYELQVALPGAIDPASYEGILDAMDRGVDVEVVTDVDQATNAGFQQLELAGVPVVYADHDIGYFDFALGVDVAWTSDMVIMSHAFAMADRTHVIAANTAGGVTDGAHVLIDATGEDLLDDLWMEFNQVAGGTDAAELTEYSGMAKSVTDYRWAYPTDDEQILELWFGPQERLLKRVIDGVYNARSSVYLLTDDLSDEGLARALQSKASHGFDVQVIVGPNFGSGAESLSAILRDETPAVDKRQVTTGAVPTIALFDTELARDDRYHRPRGMVLTHDLVSASRLRENVENVDYDGDGEVEAYVPTVTDQYIDGALWVLTDFDQPDGDLETLIQAFEEHRDVAEELP